MINEKKSIKPIIEMKNVSRIYAEAEGAITKAAVDINFEIYPQEYIVFFGPSGCGKSTILYLTAGLRQPTKGEVLVNGRNLSGLGDRELSRFHRSSIGMVFQAYYLIPSLRVIDNVALPQIFEGVDRNRRKEKALELLEKFSVKEQAYKSPVLLSGGQQQRVAISRSLVNNPPIILADEPVGNLDSKSASNVIEIFRDLNQREKRTVIMVTHNPAYLSEAHRVFYMKDGKIVREIVNSKRKQVVKLEGRERIPTELERLARVYPHLTSEELRAKSITNYLIEPFDAEKIGRLENIIKQYVQGRFDKKELVRLLDNNFPEGGGGLYKQTAKVFADKIDELLDYSHKIHKQIEKKRKAKLSKPDDFKEQATEIMGYLLNSRQLNIDEKQAWRMTLVIAKRLAGMIDDSVMMEEFDKPFKDGGVGLNIRSARNLVRDIDILLMIYSGEEL